MNPALAGWTDQQLEEELTARRRHRYATLGVCDGWARATEDIEMLDSTIEPGDWIWRDSAGCIRLAYGILGGSCMRAHVFDVAGSVVNGVEEPDFGLPDGALIDRDGVYPLVRAFVEGLAVESGGVKPC